MEIAKILVSGTEAKVIEKKAIPTGLVGGYITVEYLDPFWSGLTKTVVFRSDRMTKDVVTSETNVTIPAEIVENPADKLYVGFYGTRADQTLAVPTLWGVVGPVKYAAEPSGDETTDPSLPVWAQLAERVENLEEGGTGSGSGEGGGYYIPAVTQPDANQVEFSFMASQEKMPDVEPVKVGLPYANAVLYQPQELTKEQREQVRENIGAADGSIVEKTSTSPNLFNLNDPRIQQGLFLSNSGIVELNGFNISHPIYLQAGIKYKWFHDTSNFGTNCSVGLIKDETTMELDTIYFFSNIEKEGTTDYQVWTPSISGKYIVCTYYKTQSQYMLCEYDKYPSSYCAYGEGIQIASDVYPNEVIRSGELWKKKLALNGDSVCATPGGGYGAIIANRNNMAYQNISESGATITAEQYHEDGSVRHWVSRTIADMDANADYVILEGGVNDSSLGVPMGEITTGFSSTLDDTTFCGAFESMLKQLIIRFAGKKIGYIAVHKISNHYRSENDPDDGTSYYWAAKKCCEKWGVPFLDLNNAVPPFAYFAEDGDAELYALRTKYTQNGDGWHPTEEGFSKYYVPKIEAWLKTL